MATNFPPPPKIVALAICDHIWFDPASNKCHIEGTFDVINGQGFPIQHSVICVYAALTNGRGRIPIKVRIVDVDEERGPVAELVHKTEFPDPHVTVECSFEFRKVEFTEPGRYQVQVFAGDAVPLAERTLTVRDLDRFDADL